MDGSEGASPASRWRFPPISRQKFFFTKFPWRRESGQIHTFISRVDGSIYPEVIHNYNLPFAESNWLFSPSDF